MSFRYPVGRFRRWPSELLIVDRPYLEGFGPICRQDGWPAIKYRFKSTSSQRSPLSATSIAIPVEHLNAVGQSQFDYWLHNLHDGQRAPNTTDEDSSSTESSPSPERGAQQEEHGLQVRPFDDTKDSVLNSELDLDSGGDVTTSTSLPLWMTRSAHTIRTNKVDLSYVNVRDKEGESEYASVDKSSQHSKAFQDWPGLRRLMVDYMELRPTLFWADREDFADPESFYASISRAFSTAALERLEKRGFVVEDVETWAWIIQSKSVADAVARWVFFSRKARTDRGPRLPWFVLLQILRTPSISSSSLKQLLQELDHIVIAKASVGQRIDSSLATILVVRLLRHARLVRPLALPQISSFATQLVSHSEHASSISFSRLGHVYNRFLSLIALPTSITPFRSVLAQQKAQICLVGHMNHSAPPIALNREGYRALVHVQLSHRKTTDERTWAQVKSLSWPPWRKDKLGIEADIEYAGRESRALRILRRMSEAGYTHGDWEEAAAVLAGRDTDKSPTIQTRTLALRRSLSWMRQWLTASHDKEQLKTTNHDLWAARVTATRTLKEAWATFCTYTKSCQERKAAPYYAMLEKLLARKKEGDAVALDLPGDSRETYPEPVSPRDQAYVAQEPPSVPEFHQQMLRSGIRPAGRVLQSLVDHASDLSSGLQYIENSAYDEVKKDVILHAEKYDAPFIQSIFQKMPGYLIACYVHLFIRFSNIGPSLREPCSASSHAISTDDELQTVPADIYGITLLELAKPTHVPAWNAALEALIVQDFHVPLEKRANHTRDPVEKWKLANRVLNAMRNQGVVADFGTVHAMTRLGTHLCLRDTSATRVRKKSLTIVKQLFASAVAGRQQSDHPHELNKFPTLSVPDAAQLTVYVTYLGVQQDVKGILDLIQWLHQEHEAIMKQQKETMNGLIWLRKCLALCRTFLQGSWTDEQHDGMRRATAPELDQAVQLLAIYGWPSDEEVGTVLSEQRRLFLRLRRIFRTVDEHE